MGLEVVQEAAFWCTLVLSQAPALSRPTEGQGRFTLDMAIFSTLGALTIHMAVEVGNGRNNFLFGGFD